MIYRINESHLSVHKVKSLYSQVEQCMSLTDSITIDLTPVEYIDTAGIAMILAWWQVAISVDVVCHFKLSDAVSNAIRSYQLELP